MVDTIISLTTLPSRLHKIKPCIDSLRLQNFPVYVWIPEKVERTGDVFDGNIPEFLKKKNIFVAIVNDYGPITKLVPALNINTKYIITSDDDIIYSRQWSEMLLKHKKLLENNALCYRGRIFTDKNNKRYERTKTVRGVEKPTSVDILTGVRGAVYNRSFFGDDFYDFKNLYETKFADDVWISGYLAKKGIGRLCVPRPINNTKNIHDVKKIDALYKINWKRNNKFQHNNNTIIEYFKKYW